MFRKIFLIMVISQIFLSLVVYPNDIIRRNKKYEVIVKQPKYSTLWTEKGHNNYEINIKDINLNIMKHFVLDGSYSGHRIVSIDDVRIYENKVIFTATRKSRNMSLLIGILDIDNMILLYNIKPYYAVNPKSATISPNNRFVIFTCSPPINQEQNVFSDEVYLLDIENPNSNILLFPQSDMDNYFNKFNISNNNIIWVISENYLFSENNSEVIFCVKLIDSRYNIMNKDNIIQLNKPLLFLVNIIFTNKHLITNETIKLLLIDDNSYVSNYDNIMIPGNICSLKWLTNTIMSFELCGQKYKNNIDKIKTLDITVFNNKEIIILDYKNR